MRNLDTKERLVDLFLRWKIPDPRQRRHLVKLVMSDAREQERKKSGYQDEPSDLEMLEPEQLEIMELNELAERFEALAVAKDEADGIPEGDRMYWQLDYVVRELERRDGDQRRMLLPLYAHQDIRVRFEAAEATRELEPELSRDRLNNLDDEDWSPPLKGKKRKSKLQSMSTDQLVDRFRTLALEQDEARLDDQIPRFNRLFMLLNAIVSELENRKGDQRKLLIPFLQDENVNVRLQAAEAVAAISPKEARRALEVIIANDEYPQSMDAKQALARLDRIEEDAS